ncbi:5-methyltetrahydropteroyltriglutamate--homocysteine S-methyltransferase [Erythrobacter arachoides]|uniref:5-methyltetrahydropteroyltriglutamate--homocysteine S-methyltransferase n=1 Tax=Aurantiacibacter arachoides TaxID=1850444 RepID=A0A844ZYW4_9SPHN|nr:5-methyltetrahydropteroyltriglutamate--homocysteine S-methyltransferase [Aurantiacibacter arachoides]MXO92126.1 5-methyltetrahydropteroyltriglutamate--homocysteine S-methyltransferase [Aurantiacibacter arachoides]GGD59514.1 5-methyltetrahydropteroyltriglutamate--homocysteine S-methyltransferase [Aurantiacibacter arachoides]
MTFKLPSRADHVGSFLRPHTVIEARTRFAAGDIDAAALRQVEDEAIAELARWEESLGLKAITDGEYRRKFFHTDFLLQLSGVEETGGIKKAFKNDKGVDVEFAPPKMIITGKVAHEKPIQRADFEALAKVVTETPKVSIPSPTMLHFRAGREGIPQEAYPDMQGFYDDVAAAYRAEIADLADAGCRYVQIDDTNLAYLCDTGHREDAARRGMDPDSVTHEYARLINASFRDAPADMVKAMHLCRGNFRSSWAAEGGYEPVAEVMFNECDIDAFFLEYDDARSGDFSPLQHLPKGKTVVLGLVSTKLGEMETKDDIKRRIDQAAQYADLDQLAISPQCGFASTVHGNDITTQQQADKIRLCVEVAEDVWG